MFTVICFAGQGSKSPAKFRKTVEINRSQITLKKFINFNGVGLVLTDLVLYICLVKPQLVLIAYL